MYSKYQIASEWLQLFKDFQEFHKKHFEGEGFSFYEKFKGILRGYHYTELEEEKVLLARDEDNDVILYDIWSARIIGSEEKAYIKIEYTPSCSGVVIIDCYLVQEKEVTTKIWERVNNA